MPRFAGSAIAIVLSLAMTAARGQTADALAPAAQDAGVALAWRLDAISSGLLGPTQPVAAWRRSAALLEAAGRLNPIEPRFPRLQVLAMLHLGDNDGAIAALRAYRKLVPADRVAQAQLIDLYAGNMETVDAKVSYFETLLDKEDVPVEVRSHVAAQCASLLMQKSKGEAAEMARRAVALYPLPQATTLFYELAGRDLPLAERVAALLDVLKANPNQPAYLEEMAALLAGAGLSEESLPWYGNAIGVIMRSGASRPPGFHNLLIDFAAQEVIAGHASTADTFLGQMLDELPLDPDAWFLKLTIGQSSAGQVTYGQTLELARNALVRRWNGLHDEILNGPAATEPATAPPAAPSQPPASEPANLQPLEAAPVIEKLKSGNDREKKAFFVVVGDLAWFELYFDKQPDAARKWIDLMAEVPVDQNVTERLRGWLALQSGQPDQAVAILAKVAEHDPLAELGILRAAEAQKKPLDEQAASKLLDEHRVGLIGAILWSALRSDKTAPATQPAAQEVPSQLAKFPAPFFNLLDARALRRIYDVRTEPVTANVGYGDPILLKFTLTNNSDADITIGSDGLLRPDLWLDAQILGLDRQAFRGVSYDQIGNELTLRPRASTSQIVRLDEGPLYKALHVLPGNSTRLSGDVVLNPVVLSTGVVPGPGGYTESFNRSVLYSGVLLTQQSGRKQLEAALGSASASDRLRALDVLTGYVHLAARESSDASRKLTTELSQSIGRLRTDASAQVAAWASYLSATLAAGQGQELILAEMSRSADWTTRLLSLLVPGPGQHDLAARLAKEDSDATVKSAAAATVDLLEHPATQPASQPAATQPANLGG